MLNAGRLPKNLIMALVLLFISVLQAQQKQAVPVAPLPAQIAEAKSVFIAYAGGDSDAISYSGESDRTYNTFYAAMKGWGRYQLAPAPASADLIFEIGFVHPLSTIRENDDKTTYSVSPSDDPQIVLSIRDPKSNAVLWTLIRHISWAILQRNRDKNFDHTMDAMLDDIKQMVEPSVPTAKTDAK